MQSKNKSRDLSIYQYFQVLQIEWISANIRSKIYPKKDKLYWNKVKQGKEKIVNEIAEKNHLPTIFTDDEMCRIFESKVMRDKGMPNFCYKNEEDKLKQEPWDLLHYYSKGAEVRCELFGEQKVGVIKHFHPYTDSMTITVDETDYIFHPNEITRIL